MSKRYRVDFYDMIDGWCAAGLEHSFWPDREFDDLEAAKQKCAELQSDLAQGNKDCGEHYGVIDMNTNREIFCL